MSLAIVAIATNIAGLAVSGINIRDLDAIPEQVNARDCPIIYPRPDGFLSSLQVQIDSFGSTSAKKTVYYTLTYRLLGAQVGEDRGLFTLYQAMVDIVADFLDAVIANDALTGTIDLQAVDVTEFGPVSDPAGYVFHGCDILLRVMEFVN